MLYGRHQLDKAGEALIGSDPFKRNEALSVVQKWRDTHLTVLQELNEYLSSLFSERGISYAFSSMRIKRMVSIEEKLRNNIAKGTRLGGLQDIGGVRYVFQSIEELDTVKAVLDNFTPPSFSLKRVYDYVDKPKESGYRSVHYVYQYHSPDNPKYDNISVELQVRTRLQHTWAMAVETASLITKTTLKADNDNQQEWRGFFKLVSALFAREEHKPVNALFSDFAEQDFCREYFIYKEKKLIDKFNALRVVVNNDFDFDREEKGCCVLTIDFNSRTVYGKVYSAEKADEAAAIFGQLESNAKESEAVLMVAIEKIKEIREAYPSYFLDTADFLKHLAEFDNRCRLITAADLASLA